MDFAVFFVYLLISCTHRFFTIARSTFQRVNIYNSTIESTMLTLQIDYINVKQSLYQYVNTFLYEVSVRLVETFYLKL